MKYTVPETWRPLSWDSKEEGHVYNWEVLCLEKLHASNVCCEVIMLPCQHFRLRLIQFIFFNYFMIENCLELGQVPQLPGIKRMTGFVQCSTKVWLITKFPLQRHQPSLSVFGCGMSSEGSHVRLMVSRTVTLEDNGSFKGWSASWSSYPWKHLCRSWRVVWEWVVLRRARLSPSFSLASCLPLQSLPLECTSPMTSWSQGLSTRDRAMLFGSVPKILE